MRALVLDVLVVMEIEVRRNLTVSASVTCDVDMRKLREELFGELTESQKERLAEAERRWKEFCGMFWEVARAEKFTDLDGNPILETTHEIGYDVGEPDEEGFANIEKVWVMPKKSEYEHKFSEDSGDGRVDVPEGND